MEILVRLLALVSSRQQMKLEISGVWTRPYKTIAKLIVPSIVAVYTIWLLDPNEMSLSVAFHPSPERNIGEQTPRLALTV